MYRVFVLLHLISILFKNPILPITDESNLRPEFLIETTFRLNVPNLIWTVFGRRMSTACNFHQIAV